MEDILLVFAILFLVLNVCTQVELRKRLIEIMTHHLVTIKFLRDFLDSF